jgi:hypothetical protein
MDLPRLRAAEWIAALGGALLLISLFAPWFSGGTASVYGLGTARLDDSFSAWQTFTVFDVMLALGAVAAIALLVTRAARRTPALGLALFALLTLAGLALTVVVIVRALSAPEFEFVEVGRGAASVTVFQGASPVLGLWLGLAGCAGLVIGGWVASQTTASFAVRR